MEKKQLTLVVVSLLVVVLSVSVAYFTAQIIGEGKTIDVASANLQVIFSHTDGQIAGTDIEPGWSSTKTFTVKNSTKSEYKYNIVLKDLVNTFVTTGYLQYKITSTNSGYNMTEFKDVPKSSTATDTVLAENVKIPVGTTQTYTITFQYLNSTDVDQSVDMAKELSGTLFITEGKTTLYDQLLADKVQKTTARPDNDSGNASYGFSGVYTSDNTKTLYTSTENGTTVYYFAGNATDNWVQFGGFYWRIIRTNSDGGIRLLYHGTSPTATDAYISFSTAYNDLHSSPKYVGYMYGDTDGTLAEARTNTNNSTIKNTIDKWYEDYLKTNYGKYLSTTAVYCNDRELAEGSTYKIAYNNLNNKNNLLAYLDKNNTQQILGAQDPTDINVGFYFVAYTRLITNKTPTYDCTNTNDKFTVSTSTGNGKLTYPIALMTADEISFAGGVYGTNAAAYYYYNSAKGSSTGSTYWYTMSPFFWNGSDLYVFLVSGSGDPGFLGNARVYDTYGVRPAISLKSCIKYGTGDGSAGSPYTIDESTSEC